MPTDYIRYDLLVQDALRSVVKKVLSDAARTGLPGEHHFNISFKTQAPGVTIPAAMRQRYPDEMAIILQHEFWDLSVNPDAFEVSLNFSRRPERLTIPFDSITGFSDPSVPFGFKLEPRVPAEPSLSSPQSVASPKEVVSPKELGRAPAPAAVRSAPAPAAKAALAPASTRAVDAPKDAAKPREKTTEKSGGAEPAKVVSIDAFRKK